MSMGLLLVDIQNDYFPGGGMELSGMDAAAARAKDLLSLFRKKKWPLFHIQHISTQNDATFFLPETEGVKIHPGVKPVADDPVIRKNYANSFLKTNLLDELKKAEVKKLVICGAMSHMCIDATTRAAADFGFECIVVHDACATKNLEFLGKTVPAENVHAAFMAALGSAYAKVVSLDDFQAAL